MALIVGIDASFNNTWKWNGIRKAVGKVSSTEGCVTDDEISRESLSKYWLINRDSASWGLLFMRSTQRVHPKIIHTSMDVTYGHNHKVKRKRNVRACSVMFSQKMELVT
jgi:hypothetical protein